MTHLLKIKGGVRISGNLTVKLDTSVNMINSVSFDDEQNTYFTRTFAAGDQTKWTYSGWFKRTEYTPDSSTLFIGRADGDDFAFIEVESGERIRYLNQFGGSNTDEIIWTPYISDFSAWTHIVVQYDTTQATDTDRVKLFLNGIQITDTVSANWPTLDYADGRINKDDPHNIGVRVSNDNEFDGRMTEINFLDGIIATVEDFGEFDYAGVWQPRLAYSGDYGTNGFRLSFSDATNTTTLGNDDSSNSNDWTATNMTIAENVTFDTPQLNYPVIDRNVTRNSVNTVRKGGFEVTHSSGDLRTIGCSFVIPTEGKWYFETRKSSGSGERFGLIRTDSTTWENGYYGITSILTTSDTISYTDAQDNFYTDGATDAGYFSSAPGTDWVGWAVDMDAGEVYLIESGGVALETKTFDNSVERHIILQGNGDRGQINFGQYAFEHTVPTGYNELNSRTLPKSAVPRGDNYFEAITYTGTGASNAVTGLSFQPDLVWIKNRDTTDGSRWFDSTRGSTKYLDTTSTAIEVTSAQSLTSFDSNGFTVGTDNEVNTLGENFVAWCWKESTTAGLDIVSYVGDGTTPRNISHSLGGTPEMIIVKNRDGTDNWGVYHHGVDDTAPQDYYLLLNTNAARVNSNILWADTAPTSSVFTVGSNPSVNADTENYVAYLWRSITGFSKMGLYLGNGQSGSIGPFIYTGFKPAFLMIKQRDGVDGWMIKDNKRGVQSIEKQTALFADWTIAEYDTSPVEFHASGFQVATTNDAVNGGSNEYIYMAFAETPFNNSRANI